MTTPLTDLRNRPLEQWKVTELKDELKRRSITTKGVKDDLVKRLEEAFRNDGENGNSGSSQQTDSGMNDNNDGGSVHVENPDSNEESVMFQENQNPNRKDDNNEKCQNLDDGDAKGAVNDYNEDHELNQGTQEMVSSPKPPSNDVAGEELKAEDPASSDALEDSRRKDDGVAEKSDYSLNQVSEKVSQVVGFQLTCESVSTDSVSIIEENENELKDSLNAYNVNLESEVVKHRNLQESSGYVPQQSGDSESLERRVQAGGNDVDQAMDGKLSLDDRRVDQQEGNSPYEDDFARNATQNVGGDINEGKLDPNGASGDVEMESKIVENEIPVVKSLREDDSLDAMAIDIRQDRKDKEMEGSGNDVETPREKRKKEGQEAGLHEPVKRQRRWNSGNNLTGDVAKVSTKEGELPAYSLGASAAASTSSTVANRPAPLKPIISRSDSTNNGDGQKERVVPPSPRPPTTSLRIDRFLRPFTLKAVQELLAKTGAVTSFWMDHIKTHCYVTYSSTEEAVATRNMLYNLQWPSNGGRQLVAEYVDPEEVKHKIEGLPQAAPAPGPVSAPPHSTNVTHNQIPFKVPAQGPAGPSQHSLPPPPPLPLPPPPPMPPAVRERQLHPHPHTQPLPQPQPQLQPQPQPLKKVEQPVVTLDDLFKKTRTNPRIYYLPLSEDEVAAKLAAKARNKGS